MKKIFKKSAGDKMEILRKGCNISRSLSPVIMHEAFEETANSKNLLSLESRQDVIISFGKKITAFLSIFSIIPPSISISTR